MKLLDMNCSPQAINKNGCTALIWACYNKLDKDIILKLTEKTF